MPEGAVNGGQMAATLLLAMGEQRAAAVFRHMDERAIATVSDAMAAVTTIKPEVVVEAAAKLAADLESAGVAVPGGYQALRRMLTAAFGDRRATEMLERIMKSGGGSMDVLANVDPKSLADQIGGERPQVLAVLIGHMNRAAAATFLAALPANSTAEIIYRYANIDTVQPAAMQELRDMLSEMLGGHILSHASMIGGVRQTADLLNGMVGAVSDPLLATIREVDPDLADRIREHMFTFDDLLNLSDQAIQLVLRSAPQERLAPAMRAASPAMRERMLGSVSNKLATILQDEIENGPQITRADAQAAQKAIIDAALELAQEGKISLGGQEEML